MRAHVQTADGVYEIDVDEEEVIGLDAGARLDVPALGLQLPLIEVFSNDPRLANLADWPDDTEAA